VRVWKEANGNGLESYVIAIWSATIDLGWLACGLVGRYTIQQVTHRGLMPPASTRRQHAALVECLSH